MEGRGDAHVGLSHGVMDAPRMLAPLVPPPPTIHVRFPRRHKANRVPALLQRVCCQTLGLVFLPHPNLCQLPCQVQKRGLWRVINNRGLWQCQEEKRARSSCYILTSK